MYVSVFKFADVKVSGIICYCCDVKVLCILIFENFLRNRNGHVHWD